jgi:hypothetical protein
LPRGARFRLGASILLLGLFVLGYWRLSRTPCESEPIAVDSLRAINYAQSEYEQTHPDTGYASSLFELREAGMISEALASGVGGAYKFSLTAGAAHSSGRVLTYGAAAAPAFRSRGSCPSYFTDETGVIRFTRDDRAATAADREIP